MREEMRAGLQVDCDACASAGKLSTDIKSRNLKKVRQRAYGVNLCIWECSCLCGVGEKSDTSWASYGASYSAVHGAFYRTF